MSIHPWSTAHHLHHSNPWRSPAGTSWWSPLLLHLSERKEGAESCFMRENTWELRGSQAQSKPSVMFLVHQGIKPGGRALDKVRGWTSSRVQPRPSGDTGRDRAGNWATSQVQDPARRQTQGKDWVPRAKKGCGFLVDLIEITEAQGGHKDLKNCCRLEPRAPGSSYWRMVSLKYKFIHVTLRIHSWGSRPLPANPIRVITKPSDPQYWHNRYYHWVGRPWSFPVCSQANGLKWEMETRVLFVPPLCIFFPDA